MCGSEVGKRSNSDSRQESRGGIQVGDSVGQSIQHAITASEDLSDVCEVA